MSDRDKRGDERTETTAARCLAPWETHPMLAGRLFWEPERRKHFHPQTGSVDGGLNGQRG
jgi:hypothetical protein